MYKKQLSFEDAFQFCKEKRFYIYPNDGFRLQLQDFDRVLKHCNYDLEKYRQIHKRLFEKQIDI